MTPKAGRLVPTFSSQQKNGERRLPYLRREIGDEADEGYSWPIVYHCCNCTCKLELLPNHTHGFT